MSNFKERETQNIETENYLSASENRDIYYWPFELECFDSNNYLPQEEREEIEKKKGKNLAIQCSVFLGILLLNFGIHLPQINSAIQEANINYARELVNISNSLNR